MRGFSLLVVLLLLIAPPRAASQVATSPRRVRFTTHEGSWLSFDVSRDGRWIAFDLLGQVWRLPIQGGVARALTDVVRDSAEFLDPVFAPDGRAIVAHGEFRGRPGVFLITTSDNSVRWIAPDTLDRIAPIQSPSWGIHEHHILLARGDTNSSGDGPQAVAVIDRDIRTAEETRIDVSGVEEVGRDGLVYSADGSEIFFNTVQGAGAFPRAGRIWRIPAAGGRARPITPAGVAARAAAPSPDGRRIAYFVIDSINQAQVWMQELTDSAGVALTYDRDVTPTRIRWLPGGDTLVYVANGRLWRLDVRTRARREIPFSATVDFERKVARLPPVRFPSPGDRVVAHGSRGFAMAPDGRSFALITLNGLWVVGTEPAAAPHKLVSVPPTAGAPAWSADGSRIIWNAGKFGTEDLFVTDTVTRRTKRVTALAGLEVVPSWSPDGRFIMFTHLTRDTAGRVDIRLRAVRATDSVVRSPTETIDLGPVVGPNATSRPQWSPSGDAVLVLGPQEDPRQRPASLRSLNGAPRRQVRGLPYDATFLQWLPRDTVVFLAASRLWRAPFDAAAGVVGKATPISEEPAAYLTASLRGDLLYVSEDGFRVRSGTQPLRRLGWPISYTMPSPPPVVIRNVRIIDGTGAPATAARDIFVERARVTRIAPAGMIAPPTGASVVDGTGRIAIPGLIDLHSHHYTPAQLRGQLYFGVTTARTITGWQRVVAHRDAVAAGEWPGPRLSVSPIGFAADWPFSNEGDIGLRPEADPNHLERAMRLVPGFAGDFVKIHSNSGFATQIRIVAAAHALGRRVTGHCAYPLALVAAGIDSKEHLGWQCTIHDDDTWYDDLIQLYARSGISVVPTLALFAGLERLRGTRAPVSPELTAMFGAELPQVVGSIRFRREESADRVNTGNAFDAARKLHRAGVPIGAGSDFELPDGMQYELEALVEASFSPLEAITAATSVAARIMGATADVGRIAPGLLADIVILDADPTENIRNTRQIWRVIQGGRVVDREQLYAPGWDTVQIPE